jgi:hypothetical protein
MTNNQLVRTYAVCEPEYNRQQRLYLFGMHNKLTTSHKQNQTNGLWQLSRKGLG